MKKLLLCFSMIFCLSNLASAECHGGVGLNYKPKGTTHSGTGKSPVLPWIIDLTDNIITMSATPCDYTLNLYDEDGEIVYSVLGSRGRFY